MRDAISYKQLQKRRTTLISIILFILLLLGVSSADLDTTTSTPTQNEAILSQSTEGSETALNVLEQLPIKGRAPKTGYSRDEFGGGWAVVGGCDLRNIMLARSLENAVLADDDCVALSGTLQDPYTAQTIAFVRGSSTSNQVQIDHVVALSDAWQKGAQALTEAQRIELANDPLNLLAVDGTANQEKGDSDSASWLPPNKDYRCRYVARQVAVKSRYSLWVTEAEKAAIQRILNTCPDQVVPLGRQ